MEINGHVAERHFKLVAEEQHPLPHPQPPPKKTQLKKPSSVLWPVWPFQFCHIESGRNMLYQVSSSVFSQIGPYLLSAVQSVSFHCLICSSLSL